MGKSFWDKMQLWEKMCLVLGLSILIVLLFGVCKLLYSRWKLQKYTAVAEAKVAQRQEMGDIGRNLRGRRNRNDDGDDIPFGIRAIESGIEVDGVWISRSNTPNQSSSGSPASEPWSSGGPTASKPARSPDRTSSVSNMSHLEIPQPVHGYSGGNNAYFSHSSDMSDAPFERGLSTEQFQARPISYQSEPRPISHQAEAVRAPRSRPTYQPRHSSHLRFSNLQGYDYEHDNGAAMAALEGRSAGATPGYDARSRSSS